MDTLLLYYPRFLLFLVFIMIVLLLILAFCLIYSVAKGFRPQASPSLKNADCHIQSVGIIKGKSRTGLTINESHQLRIELDVIAQDGTLFPSFVRRLVPIELMYEIKPGTMVPIVYNPENLNEVKWDEDPNPEIIQKRILYRQYHKHPSDISFDYLWKIFTAGNKKRVYLKDLRLSGQKEGDDFKAQITVCPDNENPAKTLSKNTYISEAMLNYLVPGRYIEIIYLPDDEENFLLAAPQEVYIPRE